LLIALKLVEPLLVAQLVRLRAPKKGISPKRLSCKG